MRAPGRRYPWLVVAMLWGICFFNYADRPAVFSVFPFLKNEMKLTAVELGMLGSAFAWLYGLGAPLAGAVVDRIRRKTAIMGACTRGARSAWRRRYRAIFGTCFFFARPR